MSTVIAEMASLPLNGLPVHRFRGRYDWTCPRCAKVNTNQINGQSWRVRCAHQHCRRWFALPPYQLRELVPGAHDQLYRLLSSSQR